MLFGKKKPAVKEYPEPEFPNDAARTGYRSVRERILAALVEQHAGTSTPRLNLGNSHLTALPPEIGQLTALRELEVYGEQLTALPPEIGQLTALTKLNLAKNRLTALPPEIGQLTALKELNLSHNELTSLPPQIGQLKSLMYLYLNNNQLTALPLEIGKCEQLSWLILQENCLARLPESLREHKKLRRLRLHGNVALGLPPEVLGPNPGTVGSPTDNCPELLDYYFSRQEGEKSLNEIKMILIGRGGVGKTSLVDRLVWPEKEFDPHKKETPGISLCDWKMADGKGDPVTAHVWDFAGQVIAQAMHQYFYSARTVYLLVLTGREDNARGDAEKFLRLIAAYGMEKEGDTEKGPPVIVVLNKWEDPGSARPKLDRGALRERFPFIVDFIETDCATGHGLDLLRQKLHEMVDTLPYVRAPWGKNWAAVKDELRTLTAKRPHISYEEYRKVCDRKEVKKESEQDSLSFALHALGLALNFRNDPRLCDSTVLSPHWLVEYSYKIIRWAEAHAGRLRRADLAEVMKEEPDEKMRDYMGRIMERFEILYALEGKGTVEKPEEWLVPQALPPDSPVAAMAFGESQPGERTRLRYRYRVLPEDLVPKFIVRTHSFIEDGKVWSTGVILEKNGARALIRMEAEVDRVVEITVLGPEDARRDLAGLVMEEFRRIHILTPTLKPVEETEVAREDGEILWVSVKGLETDEASRRKSQVLTEEGSVEVDPTKELNEFTAPEARDGSWKPAVFISFAHEDEKQRKELVLRLNVLMNQGLLEREGGVWHDRKLHAGDEWDGEIKSQLERADIIVLLISVHSLASTYIHNTELKRALERAAAKEVEVVPVILDGSDWKATEYPELKLKLSRFQALCADEPVLKRRPQRDAWEEVETRLREILQKLKARGPRRR